MSIGALIMFLGAGTEMLPMSIVRVETPVGKAEVSGIKPINATLLFIGIVFFLAGLLLYAKGNRHMSSWVLLVIQVLARSG